MHKCPLDWLLFTVTSHCHTEQWLRSGAGRSIGLRAMQMLDTDQHISLAKYREEYVTI